MKTPGALVEASVSVVPSVSVPVCVVESVVPRVSVPVCVVASVVPVCVVSRCVFTSKLKCVLRRTHTGSVRVCAKAPSCGSAPTSVPEPPSVEETPCASPCMEEPSCMSVTPCATPSDSPCMDEPLSVNEAPCASGVFTSVPACVLPGTPCVKGAPQGVPNLDEIEQFLGQLDHGNQLTNENLVT